MYVCTYVCVFIYLFIHYIYCFIEVQKFIKYIQLRNYELRVTLQRQGDSINAVYELNINSFT
jgi:hypothetical protein